MRIYYTIERVGKRRPHVEDVHVDATNSVLEVSFDITDDGEQRTTPAKLVEVVRSIGYDTTIR